jgi:hypothetical protein
VHSTVSNPDKPRLGIWVTGQEAMRCREHVFGYLKGTGVNVNCDDLPPVTGFNLGADLAFVDIITTSGMLFFTVARLPHGHCCAPL